MERPENDSPPEQVAAKENDLWQRYRIQFDRMQQQNLDSGRIRNVRRIPGDATVSPEEDDVPKGGVWAEPLDATTDKEVCAEKSMKRNKMKSRGQMGTKWDQVRST